MKRTGWQKENDMLLNNRHNCIAEHNDITPANNEPLPTYGCSTIKFIDYIARVDKINQALFKYECYLEGKIQLAAGSIATKESVLSAIMKSITSSLYSRLSDRQLRSILNELTLDMAFNKYDPSKSIVRLYGLFGRSVSHEVMVDLIQELNDDHWISETLKNILTDILVKPEARKLSKPATLFAKEVNTGLISSASTKTIALAAQSVCI